MYCLLCALQTLVTEIIAIPTLWMKGLRLGKYLVLSIWHILALIKIKYTLSAVIKLG